jgi:hypothetical protein
VNESLECSKRERRERKDSSRSSRRPPVAVEPNALAVERRLRCSGDTPDNNYPTIPCSGTCVDRWTVSDRRQPSYAVCQLLIKSFGRGFGQSFFLAA